MRRDFSISSLDEAFLLYFLHLMGVVTSVFSSLDGFVVTSSVVFSSVDVVAVSLDESIFDYFCRYHSLYYLEKYFPYDFLQLLLPHRQRDQNQCSTN